ncbi:MAG: radical SAM family heme chaperone HemW [Oscillospiraceae bacterium]
MNSGRAGIYLHVPFCRAKCPYCDFYSRAGSDREREDYVAAAGRALEAAPFSLSADTLYFGGGTPSLLGASALLGLAEAAARRFGLPADAEITLEANPGTVDAPMLRALRAGGFTRISFGVQSTDDAVLLTLGRRHTAAEAERAICAAHDAGFSHISADLMLAVPGQTVEGIVRDVAALAAWPIDHLSAYLLQLEPQTAFARRYAEPKEDFAADCYLAMVDACAAHGFSQYEISSFARAPAAKSRHNLKYWRCEEYLGIGPAAHSFVGGRRFYFPRELDSFLRSGQPWSLCVDDGPGGGDEERLLLGLRLCEGICPAQFPAREAALLRRAAPMAAAGLLQLRDGRIALTARGFLVSNRIIAALLE